jgi:heat shock protein HtpX
MNQRQWIQMDDTTGTSTQKIARIGWSITSAVTVVFLVIGLVVSLPLELAVVGFIGGYLFARSIRNGAQERVRASLTLNPASENEQARIFNVVDGLCVVSGDHRPAIEVLNSEFPVALAFGDANESTIVVSNGFCALMDRVETEAVIAHLLWRIRTGDVELTAYLMNLVASLSRLKLASVARFVVSRAQNDQAILWADIAACQATRYPPALASALEKVEQCDLPTHPHVTFPLWFATPSNVSGATSGAASLSNLDISYPSLADRIGVLKEI